VTEDESGDSEDGEDDELPCVIHSCYQGLKLRGQGQGHDLHEVSLEDH